MLPNNPDVTTTNVRARAFGSHKVIKKTTGLYRSKRFHGQLVLIFSIAIVSLVFGILYFHQCPIQSHIPLFLVIQGAAGISLLVVHVFGTVWILCITKFKYQVIVLVAGMAMTILLFSCGWFIAGNVWVFSVTSEVQFHDLTNPDSYCHPTVYRAAFAILIAQYLLSMYFCCSLTWMPQSTESPTNGVIKVRKQIPKIRRMLEHRTIHLSTVQEVPDDSL